MVYLMGIKKLRFHFSCIRNHYKLPALLLLTSLLFVSCDLFKQSDIEEIDLSDSEASVAVEWFNLSLELAKETPGFSPPVVSRAYAYMGLSFYESIVPGMSMYQSMTDYLNGLESLPMPESSKRYNWLIVANSSLAEITRNLYRASPPNLLEAIDKLEEQQHQKFKNNTDDVVIKRSIKHGKAVAAAIFEWSKTDGGYEGYENNFSDDFDIPEGPGEWIPTPPDYLPPLHPYWGENRPFIIESPESCPISPPEYSEDPSSQFYTEALEVYETVKNLTDEQRVTALYWADDPGETATPPGHWISILNQVIVEHEISIQTAAEAYVRLGVALADAFITCWDTKYQYNLIRPISYIQQVIDPEWNDPEITDPVITPPFPEYTSGHSVQSGAAATVLTHLFGDLSFENNTHDNRGFPPRMYPTFQAAAEEAALSRLYGGIHYRTGIENGIDQGECIGDKVNEIDLGL